jgi:hypothetical protein
VAAAAGVEAPSTLPAQRASALGAFFSAERQAGAVAQAGTQPAPASPVAAAAPAAPYPGQPADVPAAGQDGGLPSRRVRGANLPDDLGDSEETAVPRRDPSSIGRQLSGLQASTARARHEAAAAGQPGDHDTLGS